MRWYRPPVAERTEHGRSVRTARAFGLSRHPPAASGFRRLALVRTLRARLAALVERGILPLTIVGLAAGLAFASAGQEAAAAICWTIPSAIVAVRLAWSIVVDLLHREAGVDIIAILAIGGALLLGEQFAAAVIALMLATGEALERWAEGRAQRELSALLGRAPQVVHRYAGGSIEAVSIDAVAPGDRLLVRSGEVVPVDGLVLGGTAVLDESALTGEARPVVHDEGDTVSSGVVNAGSPFDLHAIATAEDSTYAGIVRLVEAAGRSKAPFVRLADRYAILFVPLTLAIAAIAGIVDGDPTRALAVLVVATPWRIPSGPTPRGRSGRSGGRASRASSW
jgi:cation transport ATPase